MTYQAEGDQFCGRMLAMLPLLQASFAVSAPHFRLQSIQLDDLYECVQGVFPSFDHRGSMGALLQRCLASLVYHKEAIMALPMSHFVRQIEIYRDAFTLQQFSEDVHVTHPWENDGTGNGVQFGSGIPPHVALQVSQQVMIANLKDFVANFSNTMDAIFDQRNVAAGGISEHRMRNILEEMQTNLQTALRQDIDSEIQRYGLGGPVRHAAVDNGGPRSNHRRNTYTVHAYGGRFNRVPEDWRLPRGSLRSLWLAWNLGDTVNNIPPIRALNTPDVKHLDALPNPNNEKRRPARKTMSDIRFLCNYIQSKAQEANVWSEEMTRQQLTDCLDQIASVENGLLSANDRRAHTQWQTACRVVRKIVKANSA